MVELLVATAVLATAASLALLALGHTLRAGSLEAEKDRRLLAAEERLLRLTLELSATTVDGEPSAKWGRDLWESLRAPERARLCVVAEPGVDADGARLEIFCLRPEEEAR